MNIFFNQLFDYNFYCNKQLIDACSEMDNIPAKSKELFSHILNTHQRWNALLTDKKPEYDLFQIHEVDAWADIHYENQRNSFEIITSAEDFEKRFDYQNSDGRLFTNTVQDTLFHIINHSTHHRGQIAMNFRNNDIAPIPLDYITYKR